MKKSRIGVLALSVAVLVSGALVAVAQHAEAGLPGQHNDDRGARQHTAGELQFKGEPVDLGPAAPRVGELIADLSYTDIQGAVGTLSGAMGDNGLVVVMRDVFCPVSRKYGPRLGRIEDEYAGKGFGFLYLDVNPADNLEVIGEEIAANGFDAPYVFDSASPIAAALAAQTSTEIFVLDAARTLQYRGAVDDQYGIGFTKREPTKNFLREALDAVASGETIEVKGTMAPGCYLSRDESVAAAPELTYHGRVSRIIQDKCQECHRPGGVGPFPMMTYEQVHGRRDMINWVLSDGIMPPWYADEGSVAFGNDFSLTDRQKADILAWIAADAPAGDPADAPLPRTFMDGWTIGEPDAIFQIETPYTIPAEGTVDYQYTYVKTNFAEDRWVKGMEILPTAPQVTHHVLVFVETPELHERIRNAKTDEEKEAVRRDIPNAVETYFASTVPGQVGLTFPDGLAKKLPAGAWLKFQLHYTANGREAVDQSRLGLIFTDEAIRTEVRTNSAFEAEFIIPAGAKSYNVVATHEFEEDAEILSLLPHTHLRGTEFYFELVYPDGTEELLLPISRYDFNWQLNYELAEPKFVPHGTLLRATAVYDNSADNPANPDPTVDVEFGEQTWEEMLIGYVNWVPAGR